MVRRKPLGGGKWRKKTNGVVGRGVTVSVGWRREGEKFEKSESG